MKKATIAFALALALFFTASPTAFGAKHHKKHKKHKKTSHVAAVKKTTTTTHTTVKHTPGVPKKGAPPVTN